MKMAAEFLQSTFGSAPSLCVVLGSGLSGIAEEIENLKKISVTDLPGGKRSSVEGHSGEILVGDWRSHRILCLSGRLHGYEGHCPADVVFTLRSFRAWGVKKFILTNASGSTHKDYSPGEIVCISDHINFTGSNPLLGKELFGGPRFPDSSNIWTAEWRRSFLENAKKTKGLKIKEAVYIGVLGPSYETAAEIRMFAKWGADIVGMSTVWEALALGQLGSSVLGLSLVTNYGTGVISKALSHEEVLAVGKQAFENFREILEVGIQTA